jgi:Zn-dependent peptidase ImmA (M78 family)
LKFDLLLHHCADLGINVDYEDLGPTRFGEYRDDESRIVLNSRNRADQMLSTLGHEISHAIWRENGRTARCARADEGSAALIISPEEYAAAEREVGDHAGALAEHLGVTRRIILAWRRWFARTQPPIECEAD